MNCEQAEDRLSAYLDDMLEPPARTELAALAPGFGWDEYFKDIAAPTFAKLDIEWPDFLKRLPLDQPLDSWKAYFAYHVLRTVAPQLSKASRRRLRCRRSLKRRRCLQRSTYRQHSFSFSHLQMHVYCVDDEVPGLLA